VDIWLMPVANLAPIEERVKGGLRLRPPKSEMLLQLESVESEEELAADVNDRRRDMLRRCLSNSSIALVALVVSNIGTEQGRDRTAECLESAYAEYLTCAKNPFVVLLCSAELMASSALCLID
jgi:hypothetical protein